jgi:bla regulator protein BlaR1
MVGFVLLFNTKIVAQIAPPPPPIPASVIPPPPPPRLASDTLVVGQLSSLIPPPPPMVSEMSIALSIEAASSEESLNREISFFKEYGISLSFNKIKRNSKGLITGIKAAFKSEAGTSGVYAVNGDMPISNFEFFAELDGDEKLVNAGFRAKAEEILKHFKVWRAYGGKSKTPKSLIYRQRVNDSISASAFNITVSDSLSLENLENQPLYIVDGKEQPTSKNIKDIKPNDIESIRVLKGESAVKKYGEKASNGAIEISLKKEK